jgi:ectoine hydroxylase-related dioxygenase (phytanoyl-CoA dioxygenase family)
MTGHLQKLKEKFDIDGFVILENVITENECDEIKKILEQDVEKFSSYHHKPKSFSDHGLENKSTEKIVFNLHNKHIEYYKMIDNKSVRDFLDVALKEGSYLNAEPYLLLNNSARCPLDSVKPQQLHIDSRFPGTKYPLMILALWMLDDFTELNGSTRVVPKSHLSGTYPENDIKYEDEIIVTGKKGSVLLFNASLWHGGGENFSGESRWSAIFSYGRWFLKPSFDFNKNMPKEIFTLLSDSQKELLGYKSTPPIDEFTRIRRLSDNIEVPVEYTFPINK